MFGLIYSSETYSILSYTGKMCIVICHSNYINFCIISELEFVFIACLLSYVCVTVAVFHLLGKKNNC